MEKVGGELAQQEEELLSSSTQETVHTIRKMRLEVFLR